MGEAAASGSGVEEAGGTIRVAASQDAAGVNSLVKVLNSTYGPYAFGVVSTLVIWFFVVKPELESRKIDLKAHQEIVEKQREQTATMERTSNTLKDAGSIQERVVEGLSRAIDRMERVLDK